MLNRLSIAKRLVLLILAGGGLLLSAFIYLENRYVEQSLSREIRERCRAQADNLSRQVSAMLDATQSATRELTLIVSENVLSREELSQLVQRSLESHPNMSAVGVYLDDLDGAPFLPYAEWKSGKAVLDELQDHPNFTNGGYREYDWYRIPANEGPCWIEPYIDDENQILMVSYGDPIRSTPGGATQGVVGVDLSLEDMKSMCEALDVVEGGYVFMLSRKGEILVHPDNTITMGDTLFDIAEKQNRPDLRDLANRMTGGESDVIDWVEPWIGDDRWLAFAPVQAAGWSIGVVYPHGYLYEQLFDIARRSLISGAVALVVLAILACIIAWAIATPILRLQTAVREVAEGNLDAAMPPVSGSDEIASLTQSFSAMKTKLKAQIAALQMAAEERGRIESDLKAARAIQDGLLPKGFEFGRRDLEVFALMEPAKEVGGDLYDFGFLDQSRFFIAVGDVSGKGVPAALFMSLARTYLRFYLNQADVGTALTRMNQALAADNDTMMFVTAFCAVVDLDSGACEFANAGHMPPYLSGDSGITKFPDNAGFLAGPVAASTYSTDTFQLAPGDALLLYTDGIVEAQGPEGQFGEDRLRRVLESAPVASCETTIELVRESVRNFVGDLPQSDDITLLMLRFMPRGTVT